MMNGLTAYCYDYIGHWIIEIYVHLSFSSLSFKGFILVIYFFILNCSSYFIFYFGCFFNFNETFLLHLYKILMNFLQIQSSQFEQIFPR